MESLIYDENEIRTFLENVVLPLEDEVYIMMLTIRKKYCPDLSRSQEVVKREIIRKDNIDYIIRKVTVLGLKSVQGMGEHT